MVNLLICSFNSFKLCMLIWSECNIQNEHIHLLRVKCNNAINWKAWELNLNVFRYVIWWSFEIALHGFPNLTTSGANRVCEKWRPKDRKLHILTRRTELCVNSAKMTWVRSVIGNYRRKLPPTNVVSCSMRVAAFVKRNVLVSVTETSVNGTVPQHVGAFPNDVLT
jgi:hypothetical protein